MAATSLEQPDGYRDLNVRTATATGNWWAFSPRSGGDLLTTEASGLLLWLLLCVFLQSIAVFTINPFRKPIKISSSLC